MHLCCLYSKADLCICLGTSLQILPCGALPLLTRRSKGNVAIVNLQSTKRDRVCQLRIFASVDDVMMALCEQLNVTLLPWNGPTFNLHSIHRLTDESSVPNTVVDEELLLDNASTPIQANDSKLSIAEMKTSSLTIKAKVSMIQKPSFDNVQQTADSVMNVKCEPSYRQQSDESFPQKKLCTEKNRSLDT